MVCLDTIAMDYLLPTAHPKATGTSQETTPHDHRIDACDCDCDCDGAAKSIHTCVSMPLWLAAAGRLAGIHRILRF